MLSIVINRGVTVALLVSAIACSGSCWAVKPEPKVAPVVLLYKDFAWQAFASQAELFGGDLSHQRKSVLERYFTSELAALLVQDTACQARSSEICNLDFDLLFDSQDPSVSDLEVQTNSAGMVCVEFKNPLDEGKTQIEFSVAWVAGKWKIADIWYRKKSEPSLKKILSRKIP